MLFLLALLAFSVGFSLPVQTLANTRLTEKIGSPIAVAWATLAVAVIMLAAILAVAGFSLLPAKSDVAHLEWWVWTAGLFSIIGITGNILIFPRLGAVETALWPMIGSILGSLAIDHFGWLGSQVQQIGLARIIGGVLMMIGIVLAVAKPSVHTHHEHNPSRIPWRIFGFLIGVATAMQIAISGYLGHELNSALQASLISSTVGLLVLTVIAGALAARSAVVAGKSFTLPTRQQLTPLWLWIGGPIGVFYVLGLTYLQPLLGTGVTMMLNVVGQITASAAIDHFGVAGTPRAPITIQQILGIVLMLGGIAAIQLM